MAIIVTLCPLPEWNQEIPIDSNMITSCIPPQFRWIACWPRCVQEVLLGTAWCQWQLVKLSSTPRVIPLGYIFSMDCQRLNLINLRFLACTCFPRNARASQIECCSQVVADRLKSRRNHSWKHHKSHDKLSEQNSNDAQGIQCIHGISKTLTWSLLTNCWPYTIVTTKPQLCPSNLTTSMENGTAQVNLTLSTELESGIVSEYIWIATTSNTNHTSISS